jgi:hypothetical protein
MNNKVFKHLNNLATILFVIGGMLLYQGNEKGVWAICAALIVHAIFRYINLDVVDLKKLIFLEILKLVNATFIIVVTLLFLFDTEAVPYIFAAMVFDFLLNIPLGRKNK